MGQADWTELNDGLAIGTVDRGVTAGITPPPGGGTFVFGFNSLDASVGCVGFFANQVNFAPMAKGGSLTGVLKRGASGGPTGFSPMLFMGAQGPSVNDSAYKLGLSNEDPHRILLRKSSIASGMQDVTVAGGLLRTGSDTYVNDTYVHLRLDMVVNLNGDVILNCFQNDLGTNPLSGAANWVAIPGISQFIDDALGINSGSAPFVSGRGGYAFQTADVTRRAFTDHITLERQT